jgi:hypothetical protein
LQPGAKFFLASGEIIRTGSHGKTWPTFDLTSFVGEMIQNLANKFDLMPFVGKVIRLNAEKENCENLAFSLQDVFLGGSHSFL